MTLYMTLGGRNAIMQAMPVIRNRLQEDPCFDEDGLHTEFTQSGDLCEFLIFLSGGAPIYDGKPFYELLAPLCNGPGLYDRFVDHLIAVLVGNRHTSQDEEHLREIMSNLRPQVLDPKPVAPTPLFSIDGDVVLV
ncbi:MAG: Clp protease ClpP [Roseibium sp.]